MELDYLYGVVWLQTAASAQCWILVWLLYICTILLICRACIRCCRIVPNSISYDDPRNTWIYSTLKIHRSAKPILTFASLLVQVFPEKKHRRKKTRPHWFLESGGVAFVWCFCMFLCLPTCGLPAFLPSCLIALLVSWLALCVVIFFGTCDVLTPFVLEDARWGQNYTRTKSRFLQLWMNHCIAKHCSFSHWNTTPNHCHRFSQAFEELTG